MIMNQCIIAFLNCKIIRNTFERVNSSEFKSLKISLTRAQRDPYKYGRYQRGVRSIRVKLFNQVGQEVPKGIGDAIGWKEDHH